MTGVCASISHRGSDDRRLCLDQPSSISLRVWHHVRSREHLVESAIPRLERRAEHRVLDRHHHQRSGHSRQPEDGHDGQPLTNRAVRDENRQADARRNRQRQQVGPDGNRGGRQGARAERARQIAALLLHGGDQHGTPQCRRRDVVHRLEQLEQERRAAQRQGGRQQAAG